MLTIIGCGNVSRSDDGAGPTVVARLLECFGGTAPPGIQIFDAGTAGIEVMFKARGSRSLILVDASSTGAEPGSVFEVPGHVLESVQAADLGLHGFRWDHALHAGKKIFRGEFPARVTVYLIEGQSLALGIGLSLPVERAVSRVVELISTRIGAEAPPARVAGGAAQALSPAHE